MTVGIYNAKSYTEAKHTVYADVESADPILISGGMRERAFIPRRIAVFYYWRTQLGDESWTIGNIHVSGPWAKKGSGGSGFVILGMDTAPQWAKDFAVSRMAEIDKALVGEKE